MLHVDWSEASALWGTHLARGHASEESDPNKAADAVGVTLFGYSAGLPAVVKAGEKIFAINMHAGWPWIVEIGRDVNGVFKPREPMAEWTRR